MFSKTTFNVKIDSKILTPSGKTALLFRTSEEELDLIYAMAQNALKTFPHTKETTKAGERLRAMCRTFGKYKKEQKLKELSTISR